MENITTYHVLLMVLVVGILLLKKIASCIIRMVITLIMLAILAFGLYYLGLI